MNFRATPADPVLEKHVLGGAMLDPDPQALLLDRLTEESFWLPVHQRIFRAIAAAKGGFLDYVGLSHVLPESDRDYLPSMSAEVVSHENIAEHIASLQALTNRRRLIAAASRTLEGAYDLSKPFVEVQEQAESDVLAIGETLGRGSEMKSMRQVLALASQNWEATLNDRPMGMLSYVEPVDDLVKGFRPGKLYILAARPGLGKSMLALQIAMRCRRPVAHFSMEMLVDEQAERMISQVSDLNSESLQSKEVLLHKAEALVNATNEIKDLPIWFCDDPIITPATIQRNCRRLKRDGGLGLVVVDYLQLVHSVEKYQTRDLEVGAVSKFLKNLSMKLAVPVLAIASLSRKSEERTDKRPILPDLRESGNIESDADGVLLLYREADYNPQAKKDFPDVTEIILAKMRGGKRGRAISNFDGAHSKFYKLHPADAERYLDFIGQKKKAEPPKQEKKPHAPYKGFLDD